MVLDNIVADKRRRLIEHKAAVGEAKMRKLAEQTPMRSKNCFNESLRKSGLSIIEEFKKASPSLGQIAEQIDLPDRAMRMYGFLHECGVDAVLVGRALRGPECPQEAAGRWKEICA